LQFLSCAVLVLVNVFELGLLNQRPFADPPIPLFEASAFTCFPKNGLGSLSRTHTALLFPSRPFKLALARQTQRVLLSIFPIVQGRLFPEGTGSSVIVVTRSAFDVYPL